ncbi:hypothetical protein [Aquimarina sp. MMG016]|uniref:hypothetical protein n=1 Tax=Aquimarina sp. MMG016 TaxID=2822690 RepID=UPI001B3A7072|nr:hypothetical protein [Aquimarina sp. MMG016]MBQ4821593.1 hypothetical protein [Aquimarina sp. MMG016]
MKLKNLFILALVLANTLISCSEDDADLILPPETINSFTYDDKTEEINRMAMIKCGGSYAGFYLSSGTLEYKENPSTVSELLNPISGDGSRIVIELGDNYSSVRNLIRNGEYTFLGDELSVNYVDVSTFEEGNPIPSILDNLIKATINIKTDGDIENGVYELSFEAEFESGKKLNGYYKDELSGIRNGNCE